MDDPTCKRRHPPIKRPLEERFWDKVDRRGPDECWPWTAAFYPAGYGAFGVRKGKLDGAHRVSYELTHGPIPEGMCVLHSCDHRWCVNPAHLRVGDRKDNAQDKVLRGRHIIGSAVRTSKLDENAVRRIREAARLGRRISSVALCAGVSHSHVLRIVAREHWVQVE